MPISQIHPYQVPDTFPKSCVNWSADPSRSVLLLHDLQRYFLAPFAADCSPISDLTFNVTRLLRCAYLVGVPIIYTAQPGGMSRAQRGLLADFWGDGMGAGSEREIAAAFAPRQEDVVLTKWRYSAFHDTGLDQALARMSRDQLIITGVYANTGCLATAVDSFSRDLETFFVHDAVADFTVADHRQALHYAATRCARVCGTAQIEVELQRHALARPATS